MSKPARLRCAVYTRKSSEEGLEQSFNSLHAQREACEAYVKSQQHEGWTLIRTAYDDGGFSGGSMDRPGLKVLMADIEAGLVDVVVVYKVDRLTRSLTDFSRIVERFDAKGVSFVSVTQAFNTTTSMGRLTLNVLLSFAQFEREVTGERIRDKIKASKAKGMWMGGTIPLGYDAKDRALVPNPAEAETVRRIFQRYLDLGSVRLLEQELAASGACSKVWETRKGILQGGKPFSRGQLYALLQNPLYIGRIRHKSEQHPGLHQAIVDAELYHAVQRQLAEHRPVRGSNAPPVGDSVLKGLLYDAEGIPMSPATGGGQGGRRYRYYVSSSLQCGRKPSAHGILRRIAAPPLERLVADRLTALIPGATGIRDLVSRLTLHANALHIELAPCRGLSRRSIERDLAVDDHIEDRPDGGLTLRVSIQSVQRGGKTWIVSPQGKSAVAAPRRDRALIKALHAAHGHLHAAKASPLTPPAKLADPRAPADRYISHLVRMAFLAPDIQCAILEGRQPPGFTLSQVMRSSIPMSWSEQRGEFGF